MEPLSVSLIREVRSPAFFRVLAGVNAAIYVDVLDELDRECLDRSDGLARAEAVELIAEVLARHPNWQVDEDFGKEDGLPANFIERPVQEKARQVLEHLLKCHWLEEPPRRDWRRRIYFDPHGSTLMTALRKIAHPDAAVFTDKLLLVCATLADESQILQSPWQTVENCLDNTRQGLNELRAMQKSVQRLTRRQLEEKTLKGNLEVVFDLYAEEIAQSCYAELVRSRLPTRLPDAVRRIDDRLLSDPGAMRDMQTEVLRRHEGMSAEQARAIVRNALEDLMHLLEMVLPMADEIDRRTADFTRRSLSRFRYLQEVTTERRGEIRDFFQKVNQMMAGQRFSSAADLPELPAFRLPEVKLPYGRDSLQTPQTRRSNVELQAMDDDLTDDEREAGLQDMEKALRESLSVRRANEFIKSLPGGKGSRISSMDMPFHEGDSAAELLALLLHAESPEARYRLELARGEEDNTKPELDPFPGGRVERFHLIKK